MRHTPGPDCIVIPLADIDEANAALIAAAPDLLAASRQASNWFLAFARELQGKTDSWGGMAQTLADLSAAISKAEGKP